MSKPTPSNISKSKLSSDLLRDNFFIFQEGAAREMEYISLRDEGTYPGSLILF